MPGALPSEASGARLLARWRPDPRPLPHPQSLDSSGELDQIDKPAARPAGALPDPPEDTIETCFHSSYPFQAVPCRVTRPCALQEIPAGDANHALFRQKEGPPRINSGAGPREE